MSGHSKWSTIKRKKGEIDAKRGKIFTKVIKEITIAARGGGGDPDGNPRLRRALDSAKSVNMPADNITRAIKKGTGELEGVMYEELVYEGVGPAGVLFILEVTTDNRNRTAAELRKLFERNNGQLSSSGAAAWAFDQKGVIKLPADAATEEQLFEIAVGAGAEDMEQDDDLWIVTTPREMLDIVRDAIDKAGLPVGEANLEQIPKTPKQVAGRDAEVLVGLYEALDDHDDVQNLFTEFEPSAEQLG
jgi:YebC/PmpR family DNA-binding regulatory protein